MQVLVSSTDQAFAAPARPGSTGSGWPKGPRAAPTVSGTVQGESGPPAGGCCSPSGRARRRRCRRREAVGRPAPAAAVAGGARRRGGRAAAVQRRHQELQGRVHRRPGPVFEVRRGQVARPAGPQRRRQDDVAADAHGPDPAHRGHDLGLRPPATPGAPVLSRLGSFARAPACSRTCPAGQPRAVLGGHRRPLADAHLEEAVEIAGLGTALDKRVRSTPRACGSGWPSRSDARPAGPAGARRADQRAGPAADPRGCGRCCRTTRPRPHRHRLQPPARRDRAVPARTWS